MNIINGCRVIISEECRGKPRMVMSQALARHMSPEFVAEHNKWLLKFFGREPDKVFFMPEPYDITRRSQVVLMTLESFNSVRHLQDKHPIP